MHTIEELQSGKLKGVKTVKISQNLTEFPKEIFTLADSLEILDLSNNALSSIPEDIYKLKKLKILFLSFNNFTEVPSALAKCENLYMVGFKSNQIETFEEESLPETVSWLILTDNKIKKLPQSIGNLTKLQKCALAGNELTSLPQSMSKCVNLELLRLSANKLQEIPAWLTTLPKLSWFAFSGNPCTKNISCDIDEIEYEQLELQECLGEGASGVIHKVYLKMHDTYAALKLFKGSVTSDGYAQDEMDAYLAVGEHENLIKVLAKIKSKERLGLVLELISDEYQSLGNPPNFDTCTRDTFQQDSFPIDTVYAIAKSIHSVALHMHEKGLMHGDLYAHNILFNNDNKCYLGDFGAASFYDINHKNFEKIEVRAFGCLLDDMLMRCNEVEHEMYGTLDKLRKQCFVEDVQSRIQFKDMVI